MDWKDSCKGNLEAANISDILIYFMYLFDQGNYILSLLSFCVMVIILFKNKSLIGSSITNLHLFNQKTWRPSIDVN